MASPHRPPLELLTSLTVREKKKTTQVTDFQSQRTVLYLTVFVPLVLGLSAAAVQYIGEPVECLRNQNGDVADNDCWRTGTWNPKKPSPIQAVPDSLEAEQWIEYSLSLINRYPWSTFLCSAILCLLPTFLWQLTTRSRLEAKIQQADDFLCGLCTTFTAYFEQQQQQQKQQLQTAKRKQQKSFRRKKTTLHKDQKSKEKELECYIQKQAQTFKDTEKDINLLQVFYIRIFLEICIFLICSYVHLKTGHINAKDTLCFIPENSQGSELIICNLTLPNLHTYSTVIFLISLLYCIVLQLFRLLLAFVQSFQKTTTIIFDKVPFCNNIPENITSSNQLLQALLGENEDIVTQLNVLAQLREHFNLVAEKERNVNSDKKVHNPNVNEDSREDIGGLSFRSESGWKRQTSVQKTLEDIDVQLVDDTAENTEEVSDILYSNSDEIVSTKEEHTEDTAENSEACLDNTAECDPNMGDKNTKELNTAESDNPLNQTLETGYVPLLSSDTEVLDTEEKLQASEQYGDVDTDILRGKQELDTHSDTEKETEKDTKVDTVNTASNQTSMDQEQVDDTLVSIETENEQGKDKEDDCKSNDTESFENLERVELEEEELEGNETDEVIDEDKEEEGQDENEGFEEKVNEDQVEVVDREDKEDMEKQNDKDRQENVDLNQEGMVESMNGEEITEEVEEQSEKSNEDDHEVKPEEENIEGREEKIMTKSESGEDAVEELKEYEEDPVLEGDMEEILLDDSAEDDINEEKEDDNGEMDVEIVKDETGLEENVIEANEDVKQYEKEEEDMITKEEELINQNERRDNDQVQMFEEEASSDNPAEQNSQYGRGAFMEEVTEFLSESTEEIEDEDDDIIEGTYEVNYMYQRLEDIQEVDDEEGHSRVDSQEELKDDGAEDGKISEDDIKNLPDETRQDYVMEGAEFFKQSIEIDEDNVQEREAVIEEMRDVMVESEIRNARKSLKESKNEALFLELETQPETVDETSSEIESGIDMQETENKIYSDTETRPRYKTETELKLEGLATNAVETKQKQLSRSSSLDSEPATSTKEKSLSRSSSGESDYETNETVSVTVYKIQVQRRLSEAEGEGGDKILHENTEELEVTEIMVESGKEKQVKLDFAKDTKKQISMSTGSLCEVKPGTSCLDEVIEEVEEEEDVFAEEELQKEKDTELNIAAESSEVEHKTSTEQQIQIMTHHNEHDASGVQQFDSVLDSNLDTSANSDTYSRNTSIQESTNVSFIGSEAETDWGYDTMKSETKLDSLTVWESHNDLLMEPANITETNGDIVETETNGESQSSNDLTERSYELYRKTEPEDTKYKSESENEETETETTENQTGQDRIPELKKAASFELYEEKDGNLNQDSTDDIGLPSVSKIIQEFESNRAVKAEIETPLKSPLKSPKNFGRSFELHEEVCDQETEGQEAGTAEVDDKEDGDTKKPEENMFFRSYYTIAIPKDQRTINWVTAATDTSKPKTEVAVQKEKVETETEETETETDAQSETEIDPAMFVRRRSSVAQLRLAFEAAAEGQQLPNQTFEDEVFEAQSTSEAKIMTLTLNSKEGEGSLTATDDIFGASANENEETVDKLKQDDESKVSPEEHATEFEQRPNEVDMTLTQTETSLKTNGIVFIPSEPVITTKALVLTIQEPVQSQQSRIILTSSSSWKAQEDVADIPGSQEENLETKAISDQESKEEPAVDDEEKLTDIGTGQMESSSTSDQNFTVKKSVAITHDFMESSSKLPLEVQPTSEEDHRDDYGSQRSEIGDDLQTAMSSTTEEHHRDDYGSQRSQIGDDLQMATSSTSEAHHRDDYASQRSKIGNDLQMAVLSTPEEHHRDDHASQRSKIGNDLQMAMSSTSEGHHRDNYGSQRSEIGDDLQMAKSSTFTSKTTIFDTVATSSPRSAPLLDDNDHTKDHEESNMSDFLSSAASLPTSSVKTTPSVLSFTFGNDSANTLNPDSSTTVPDTLTSSSDLIPSSSSTPRSTLSLKNTAHFEQHSSAVSGSVSKDSETTHELNTSSGNLTPTCSIADSISTTSSGTLIPTSSITDSILTSATTTKSHASDKVDATSSRTFESSHSMPPTSSAFSQKSLPQKDFELLTDNWTDRLTYTNHSSISGTDTHQDIFDTTSYPVVTASTSSEVSHASSTLQPRDDKKLLTYNSTSTHSRTDIVDDTSSPSYTTYPSVSSYTSSKAAPSSHSVDSLSSLPQNDSKHLPDTVTTSSHFPRISSPFPDVLTSATFSKTLNTTSEAFSNKTVTSLDPYSSISSTTAKNTSSISYQPTSTSSKSSYSTTSSTSYKPTSTTVPTTSQNAFSTTSSSFKTTSPICSTSSTISSTFSTSSNTFSTSPMDYKNTFKASSSTTFKPSSSTISSHYSTTSSHYSTSSSHYSTTEQPAFSTTSQPFTAFSKVQSSVSPIDTASSTLTTDRFSPFEAYQSDSSKAAISPTGPQSLLIKDTNTMISDRTTTRDDSKSEIQSPQDIIKQFGRTLKAHLSDVAKLSPRDGPPSRHLQNPDHMKIRTADKPQIGTSPKWDYVSSASSTNEFDKKQTQSDLISNNSPAQAVGSNTLERQIDRRDYLATTTTTTTTSTGGHGGIYLTAGKVNSKSVFYHEAQGIGNSEEDSVLIDRRGDISGLSAAASEAWNNSRNNNDTLGFSTTKGVTGYTAKETESVPDGSKEVRDLERAYKDINRLAFRDTESILEKFGRDISDDQFKGLKHLDDKVDDCGICESVVSIEQEMKQLCDIVDVEKSSLQAPERIEDKAQAGEINEMKDYHVPRIETQEEQDYKGRSVRFASTDEVRDISDRGPADRLDYFLTTKYLQIWPNRENANAKTTSILKASKTDEQATALVNASGVIDEKKIAPSQEKSTVSCVNESTLDSKVCKVEEIVRRNQAMLRNGGHGTCFCDICANNYMEVKADGTSEYAFKRCAKNNEADILDVIARSKELLQHNQREMAAGYGARPITAPVTNGVQPMRGSIASNGRVSPMGRRMTSPSRSMSPPRPIRTGVTSSYQNGRPISPESSRPYLSSSRSISPQQNRGRLSPRSNRSLSPQAMRRPVTSPRTHRPQSPPPIRRRATSPRAKSPEPLKMRRSFKRPDEVMDMEMTVEERQRFREVTGRIPDSSLSRQTQKRGFVDAARPSYSTKFGRQENIPVDNPRKLTSFDPTTTDNLSMHRNFPPNGQKPTTYDLAYDVTATFELTNQSPSYKPINPIEAEQKQRIEKLTELELRIRTMEKLMKEI